jgi:hypothetical protein
MMYHRAMTKEANSSSSSDTAAAVEKLVGSALNPFFFALAVHLAVTSPVWHAAAVRRPERWPCHRDGGCRAMVCSTAHTAAAGKVS